MAEIKTIGIAFDPSAAQAGAEAAKRSATGLASAYETALRRIDQSSQRLGQSNQGVARSFQSTTTAVTSSTGRMAQSITRSAESTQRATTRQAGAYGRVRAQADRMAAGVGSAWQRIVRQSDRAGTAVRQVGDRFNRMSGRVRPAATRMTSAVSGITGSLIRLTSAFTPAGAQASRFASGMTQGVSAVTRMTKSIGGLQAAAGGGALGVAALVGGLGALVVVAGTAAGALGALVVAAGALIAAFKTAKVAVGQLRQGLQLAGQIQLDVLSFQAMTGSMAEATRIMGELREESKRTGAELAGSASTVKRFLALGFKPDDAIKLNKSILDVAGSIGMSTQEAKLLGVALAQVQSLGTVGMEELRTQIAEKGVPVMQELANKVAGGSIAAMRKMVSEGEVASKELIDIFLNLEGSFARFAGGAERMTQTLPGALERLNANWKALLSTAATPLAASMVPELNAASDKLGEMTGIAQRVGEVLGDGFRRAMEVIKSGEIGTALQLAFEAATEFLWNALSVGFAAAWEGVKVLAIKAFSTAIQWSIDFFTKVWTTVLRWLTGLLTGTVDFLSLLLQGKVTEAFGFATDKFEETGKSVVDVLGVHVYNVLGQAFEDVVNALKNGMTSVFEEFATSINKIAGMLGSPVEVAKKLLPGSLGDRLFGKRDPDGRANFKSPDLDIFTPKPLPGGEQGIQGILKQLLAEFKGKPTDAQDKLLAFLNQDRFKTEPPKPLPDVPVPETPEGITGETAVDGEGKKAAAKKEKAKKEKKREIPEPIDISAVQRLSIEWGNVDKQLDDLAAGSLMAVRDGMTDALTGIIDGSMSAKEAFTRMAESIIKDITRMIIQMTIQLTLQKALQAAGATQGVVTAVPVAHTGGVVGSGGMTQTSGASIGTFHAGGVVGATGPAMTRTGTSGAMRGGGARVMMGIPTMHTGGVVGAEKSSLRPKISLDLPTMHTGGTVGRGLEQKEEPQRIKIELPAFHQGGMASSEEIVKVEKGETILTRRRASELEAELEASRDGGKRERPEKEQQSATIINVFDRSEIADIIATNPNAVLNAMSRNLPAVRKLVMGGNRL